MKMLILWASTAVVSVMALLCHRIAITVHSIHSKRSSGTRVESSNAAASLAFFLGSGGHTAEMMRLIQALDWNYFQHRIYLISSGDTHSEAKALDLEKTIGSGHFEIIRIPRARRVHQSYFTSIFTTLYSLVFCLWLVTIRPLIKNKSRTFADLILLNGPGSCVPIAYSAFLLRIFFLASPSLVYIESLARTQRLSASAFLIRPIVDRFFVQWESLQIALVGDEFKQAQRRASIGWKFTGEVECWGWLV